MDQKINTNNLSMLPGINWTQLSECDVEIREVLKKEVIKPLTCFKQDQLSLGMLTHSARSDPKSNIIGDMLLKDKLNNPNLSIAFTCIDSEYLSKTLEDIKK